MTAPWVLEEMQAVDMPDARLNARLREVLTELGERPCLSIPAACGGHAEMTATYRLFDNPRVTCEDILGPHAAATRKRMAAQPTVLVAQDTSEIDVTRPAQQVKGAGPWDGGARRGLLLHLLHALTPEGTPLGTLTASVRVRPDEERAPQTRAQRAAIPIEDKESYRWLETLRAAQAEAELSPATHLLCVADSEADLYELLAEAQAEPRRIDWIVRACQDRALESETESAAARHLREEVLARPGAEDSLRETRTPSGPKNTAGVRRDACCARHSPPPPGEPTASFPPLRSTWCSSARWRPPSARSPSRGCC